MKSFVLKEILLLSHFERKAKRVKFDPRTTIVIGANDTGKSSLLKSIYRTFGAEPARTHPLWKKADVISVVRFSLDDESYSILRHGGLYAIFDHKDKLIKSFTKVTEGLGPYLAKLFDFKIRLNNKSGKPVVPPPAYLFLPYYVDQDSGWNRNWSSFAKLEQFSQWKPGLAEYHTGVRPNKFFELKSELDRLNQETKDAIAELRVLEGAKKRIKEQFPPGTFDVDIDTFREEIDRLIDRCQELNLIEESFKEQLTELRNHKMVVSYQVQIADKAIKETSADYSFATNELSDDYVDCPTCGASYQNSFAERFAIAQDEDRCRDLLIHLKQDEIDLDHRIGKLSEQYNDNRMQFEAVSRILDNKQGSIRLRDVIESEGKKEVDRIFDEHVKNYQGEIFKKEFDLNQVKDSLKHMEGQIKAKKKEITDYYLSRMRSFLRDLDVRTLRETAYNKLYSNVTETGSDLPRALLAYYYSVLHTMRQYSSSTFCSIVIDSPNQQGQDPNSLKKVIAFILHNKPDNSQLILGLEDLRGVPPVGKVIELKNKLALLEKASYRPVAGEVTALLEQVTSSIMSSREP